MNTQPKHGIIYQRFCAQKKVNFKIALSYHSSESLDTTFLAQKVIFKQPWNINFITDHKDY